MKRRSPTSNKVSSRQCGFFGTPRGLGLATASTSAAFLTRLEQDFPAI